MFFTQLYIISVLFFFSTYTRKTFTEHSYRILVFVVVFFAAVDLSGLNDKLTQNKYNKIEVNKKQLFRGNPSRAIAHVCKNFIRELNQRRRRRKRERQKSNSLILAKQQLCTRITLFCTFLCPCCTTTT